MFAGLEEINRRPEPFSSYTAETLWNDAHTSGCMLAYHLNDDVDASSRNSAFIGRSVEWMAYRFGLGSGSEIADFGCGPGLYASRLARKGANVTGIDFSAGSIAYAREQAGAQGLSIDYVNQNYLDFETVRRFDLIIMIMCDFCALSPEQRGRMLARFRKLLRPGGSVLLDVYSLAAFEAREEQALYQENMLDGFWAPARYYAFLNTFKYPGEKVVLDKYSIFGEGGSKTVYNWLQYFSPESLEREFAGAGLVVKELFADVAGSLFDPNAPEFAVAASAG